MRSNGQFHSVPYQVANDSADRRMPIEGIVDQAYDGLDLLVGIDGQVTIGELHIADRRKERQLTTPRLVEQGLVHPPAENMQLGFAHHSTKTQQQSIVVVGRI